MPKGSPDLTAAREEEIVSACERLYRTMSFKEITLKEIGNATSFTRTSIYNYFRTKEEIFLALLEREYIRWIADLEAILNRNEVMDRKRLAEELAKSLQKREQLLKLLSMNHYDMEANSRLERLTSFKTAFGNSIKTTRRILEKFCPDMGEPEIRDFIYVFFPFIYGIHPYAVVTDKQREAMERAEVHYVFHSIYEIAYACLVRLLGAEQAERG